VRSLDRHLLVSARDSKLSQVQVEEVLLALTQLHPTLQYAVRLIKTTGDKDLKTSLLHKDGTDFFTREVDDLVLSGVCDVGIHSAKDLPSPLTKGLAVVAYTKGIDPSDVLVLRDKESIESLPAFAKVGTSSLRRRENVLAMRKDLTLVDIRGTIEARLELLDAKVIDACVMAKAALIRLQINRNMVALQGPISPMQGRLAVVARAGDLSMQELFLPLHFAS
jgi:hydroxymethylbilane synthase